MSGWNLSRRAFLKAGLAGAVLASGRVSAAERPKQPNLLVIMPDQMRGDCLSCLGHPAQRTPNIDALAEEGVLWRRGYTTVPSCVAARYGYLTSLYPQTHGVFSNAGQTEVTHPTMQQAFQDEGYLTVLVGRGMHQQNPDADLGYERVISGSVWPGQTDYSEFLKENLSPERSLGETLHQEGMRAMVSEMGLTYNHWQGEPWPLDDDWHPVPWIVRKSLEVTEESPDDRPLFLTTSFYAPHPPLVPSAEFFDAYMEMDLPEPARGDWVDWEALSPPPGDHGGSRVQLEGDTLRRAQAGYFGLIEQIDDAIGPLIAAFKARSEQAGRPWVILFTSDHGEMLGDHGYFRKCEPYEGSANVPFIVAGSEDLGFQAGLRSHQLVCLEDIMPTLADLAGMDAHEELDVDGVSLAPLLRGEEQTVRPWLHMEHCPNFSEAQAFHALTDGRRKYIWRPNDGSEQLFDLDEDPREEHDLAQSADHETLLQQWRETLIERLEPRPEGFSDGEQLIAGRPYPPNMPEATP
ncbi:MAG: sulfatase-like hydrolase/transferase [Candidatus Hydrogenedentota bacterium]